MDKKDCMPVPGERYRHFKGGLYQIVTIATHSETGENLVIYQALYGQYTCYARPLEMFIGENDTGEKRFTLVSDNTTYNLVHAGNEAVSKVENDDIGKVGEQVQINNVAEVSEVTEISDSEISGNELLFRILDCDKSKDKLELIRRYRSDIDHKMLGNLAVSMDIPADSEDDDEIFGQIAQYLETRARFETDRFR